MVDQSAAIGLINLFIGDLVRHGFKPNRVFLFGSYAKGNQQEYSDIDVAIWDSKFSGCLPLDMEQLKSIISKYSKIEIHTFNSLEEPSPLSHEIEATGIRIL